MIVESLDKSSHDFNQLNSQLRPAIIGSAKRTNDYLKEKTEIRYATMKVSDKKPDISQKIANQHENKHSSRYNFENALYLDKKRLSKESKEPNIMKNKKVKLFSFSNSSKK